LDQEMIGFTVTPLPLDARLRRHFMPTDSYKFSPPATYVATPVLHNRRIYATSPCMQLRFTSFVVINLRRDLHPQECVHAWRTKKTSRSSREVKIANNVAINI